MQSIHCYRKFILLAGISVFIILTSTRAQPVKVPALYEQTSEVNNVMVQFYADYGNLSRFYVIQNSPERRERLLSTINEYINKLSQLDFDKFNIGTRADYILFNRDLHEQQYQLEKEAKEYDAIKQWFPFADSIYDPETTPRC